MATNMLQTVVIVNGSTDTLGLVETAMDAGHYDVVSVESNAHAYSQIKRVRPNLVVLCICIEDAAGFDVLSMLKLDEETRDIPVLTYTTQFEGRPTECDAPEPADVLRSMPPALRMN